MLRFLHNRELSKAKPPFTYVITSKCSQNAMEDLLVANKNDPKSLYDAIETLLEIKKFSAKENYAQKISMSTLIQFFANHPNYPELSDLKGNVAGEFTIVYGEYVRRRKIFQSIIDGSIFKDANEVFTTFKESQKNTWVITLIDKEDNLNEVFEKISYDPIGDNSLMKKIIRAENKDGLIIANSPQKIANPGDDNIPTWNQCNIV